MAVMTSRLSWDPLERTNPAFIFKLEKADNDSCFYMQNLLSETWYWDTPAFYFCEFRDKTQRNPILFEKDDSTGLYKIRQETPRQDYIRNQGEWPIRGNFTTTQTMYLYGNGSVYHPVAQSTYYSVWTLEKVSDADLKAAQMKVALRKAVQIYNDQSTYVLSDTPLITNVPDDCDPQTGEPGQFFSYCQSRTDANTSLAHLIDGSNSAASHFLSTGDAEIASKPQYIQVDVSADDTEKSVGGVQLKIGITNGDRGTVEFPTDITVYATNDATIAETTDISTIEEVEAQANWKKIGDYNLNTSQVLTTRSGQWSGFTRTAIREDNQNDNRSETKDIVFPDNQKYRFIRFYVNNTTVNATNNHQFDIAELQLYELENPSSADAQTSAIETLRNLIASGNEKVSNKTVTDADLTAIEAAMQAVTGSESQGRANLKAAIDSIKALRLHFYVDSRPGFNDSASVANYRTVLATAEAATHATHTEDEYNQIRQNLLTAVTAAQVTNPIEDGYYFITCTWGNFYHTKAMVGLPTQDILGWENYDRTNPAELFKITKIGDGQYSIQNAATGKYINTIPGQSTEVKVSDTQITAQTITGITGYPGQFNIANTANSQAYHTEFHQGGANAKGYICTYQAGANTGSAWRLQVVSDQERDDLLAVASQYNLNALAQAEVDTARTSYDVTYGYKTNYSTSNFATGGLITNCDDSDEDNCQVWAQQEPSVAGGSSKYAHLIDGNLATPFWSTWSSSYATYPQFFQVDLKDHPVSDFKFLFALVNGSWGAWEQWTDVTVFASNDTETAHDENIVRKDQIAALSTWKNIGDFRLTDEYAKRNWSGSDRKIYVDVNHMGAKYRFIRFYINKTYKQYPLSDTQKDVYTIGTYGIGDFQMYENTYDEDNMPYNYVTGLKEAADALKAQEELVTAGIAAGTVTQEQIDRLRELRKAVDALAPDASALSLKLDEVKTYVNKFAAGEEIGDVSDAEWTTIQNAITSAQSVAQRPSSNAAVDEQTSALTSAFEAFKAAQVQPEVGTWYYIVSTDLTRKGSIRVNGEGSNEGVAHTSSIWDTFVYGTCLYTPNDNTREKSAAASRQSTNVLRWGYYEAGEGKAGSGGQESYTSALDPHTMWRLVPIQGKEGKYAIQNRATGTFMSRYTGNSYIGLTSDTIPYVVELLSSGQVAIRCGVQDRTTYLYFQGDGLIYAYLYYTAPNSEWSFRLQPVGEQENLMEYPNNNTIFVKSLPYALTEEANAGNEGFAQTYAIKGIEILENGDSTLLLTKKSSFEAGEPFIVECGDYTAYDANNIEEGSFVVPSAEEFSFEEKTVNGLTATLDLTRAPKSGLGYFADAVLKATGSSTSINGHSGYFDVKNMTTFNATTEADLRIPLNGKGVDAIRDIQSFKDGDVNVYSVDGKLIKKNVKSSKAVKGLGKGIYIVGKKKVSVK